MYENPILRVPQSERQHTEMEAFTPVENLEYLASESRRPSKTAMLTQKCITLETRCSEKLYFLKGKYLQLGYVKFLAFHYHFN